MNLEKYRSEKETKSIDFANRLNSGESISSVTSVVVYDLDGNDVSSEFGNPSGQIQGTQVKFLLDAAQSAADQAGVLYVVYCAVMTSDAENLDAAENLVVTDPKKPLDFSMAEGALVYHLMLSLSDAAGVFTEPRFGAFRRHVKHAAEDFHRVQPRIRNGSITLVADQPAYAAPTDFIRLHLTFWGKKEKRQYQPWENLYPGRLPNPVRVAGASGPEIHLSPPPTSAQIEIAGASYDFLYVASHVIDPVAANTTIESHNRGLLLLRSQAEAMKELADRNMHKPVQLRDGVSGAPRNAHPAAMHEQLMKEFERLARP